jgi:hypothetical protein
VGCHQADYDATTSPDHGALGLPTACTNCHTTSPNWTPVNMNHTGLSGTCQQCHIDDYNASTSPDHEIQGYPLECDLCHTSTTSWHSTNWHHEQFPQAHAGSRCNQCHTTTQVFTSFSCISGGCHPQGATDNRHDNVNDYQYNSNACYDCHPNGQADDNLRGRTERRSIRPAAVRPLRSLPGRRAPPRRIPAASAPPPVPPAQRPR